jgi:hypothetical protein
MDWVGIATVLAAIGFVFVSVVVVTKVGIKMDRRPYRATRIHRTKGEYEPAEPPEGRYWG